MIDGKPYPVPAHWMESWIGSVVLKTKQSDPRKRPAAVFQYVDVSSVSNASFRITAATPTLGSEAPSRARKPIEKDDVLFATVRPTLKRIALVPPQLDGAIASTGYCVLRCDKSKVDPGYLYSFLITDHFNARVAGLERGASYPAVRDSDVTASWLPLPPLPEQKKIAHILSTVQRAIEAQERIIATTTELKKALMHKLFTLGLRYEPQKQTEIGPIPESWEVVPLSSCAVVQTGIAKGRKVDPKNAVVLPYLRVANVQDGYLDLTEMKTITIRKDEEARYTLREGDVVLTEGGDFDKLGRGFIWHGQVDRCVHQNHVFSVRPDTKRISSEFFAYQSQSPYGKAYFLSVAHKTTNLACINTTKLKAFPVLLPSKEQQKDIVAACQSMDGKIASARAKRSALQDLFRALLNELMTAKTRVHELNLPTPRPAV